MTGDGHRSSVLDRPQASGQGPSAQLARYLHTLLVGDQRLVVASNRGPLTFKRDRAGRWQARRGSGGLVTALAEVGRLAPVTWISAAMDQADRDAAALLRGEDGREGEELGAQVQ